MARTMDFTKGSISKQMFEFATPLFLSNMLQAVYNIADMAIIGNVIGKVGLSAVAIGGDIAHFLTFLAMGFSSAGQIIVAQHVGAGHRDKLGRIIGNLFSFLLGISLILTLVCYFLCPYFLSLMNTPKEAWDMTLDYVIISILGVFFIYGYNVVSAVLRGIGDSKDPFIFVATAAIVNVILDVLFIVVFKWSVFGAGLATVISQGISFIWGIIFLFKKQKELNIELKLQHLLFDKDIIGLLLKLGIPMAIKSASIHLSKLFVNSSVNYYGIIASGASGIEAKLNTLANLIANAVNVSSSTMVGQNIGAEKYDRVPKIILTAFSITFTADLILITLIISFPKFIFGIFTADSEVIGACFQMLPLFVALFLASALRSPSNGLIDGTGNFKLNFVVAILDGIINRIGFAILFGKVLNWGWLGYLWGDAVAGFTPFFIGLVYFLSNRWKTRKYIISK